MAVIELPEELTFSPYINQIELPSSEAAVGTVVYTSGFGVNNTSELNAPPKLRSIQLEIISRSAGFLQNPMIINRPNVVSVGDAQQSSKTVCYEDSGAPIAAIINDLHNLVAVNSFGRGLPFTAASCDKNAFYGFSVSASREWIDSVINGAGGP